MSRSRVNEELIRSLSTTVLEKYRQVQEQHLSCMVKLEISKATNKSENEDTEYGDIISTIIEAKGTCTFLLSKLKLSNPAETIISIDEASSFIKELEILSLWWQIQDKRDEFIINQNEESRQQQARRLEDLIDLSKKCEELCTQNPLMSSDLLPSIQIDLTYFQEAAKKNSLNDSVDDSLDSQIEKLSKKCALLKIGDRVEADWKRKGKYYPAKITAVRSDGTYDLAYDDGALEEEVKGEYINKKDFDGDSLGNKIRKLNKKCAATMNQQEAQTKRLETTEYRRIRDFLNSLLTQKASARRTKADYEAKLAKRREEITKHTVTYADASTGKLSSNSASFLSHESYYNNAVYFTQMALDSVTESIELATKALATDQVGGKATLALQYYQGAERHSQVVRMFLECANFWHDGNVSNANSKEVEALCRQKWAETYSNYALPCYVEINRLKLFSEEDAADAISMRTFQANQFLFAADTYLRANTNSSEVPSVMIPRLNAAADKLVSLSSSFDQTARTLESLGVSGTKTKYLHIYRKIMEEYAVIIDNLSDYIEAVYQDHTSEIQRWEYAFNHSRQAASYYISAIRGLEQAEDARLDTNHHLHMTLPSHPGSAATDVSPRGPKEHVEIDSISMQLQNSSSSVPTMYCALAEFYMDLAKMNVQMKEYYLCSQRNQDVFRYSEAWLHEMQATFQLASQFPSLMTHFARCALLAQQSAMKYSVSPLSTIIAGEYMELMNMYVRAGDICRNGFRVASVNNKVASDGFYKACQLLAGAALTHNGGFDRERRDNKEWWWSTIQASAAYALSCHIDSRISGNLSSGSTHESPSKSAKGQASSGIKSFIEAKVALEDAAEQCLSTGDIARATQTGNQVSEMFKTLYQSVKDDVYRIGRGDGRDMGSHRFEHRYSGYYKMDPVTHLAEAM